MRSETTERDTAEGSKYFQAEANRKDLTMLGLVAAGIIAFLYLMEQKAKQGE